MLIGRHIVEYEQGGKEKAEYGSFLFEQLSKDLTKLYGKGFSRANLLYMRKLCLTFPKSETLSNVLSWSHYFEILPSDNDLEINFYAKQTEKENWSVRELKRQMKSMFFHRLALSKDKKGVLDLAKQGQEIQKTEDILNEFVSQLFQERGKRRRRQPTNRNSFRSRQRPRFGGIRN